MPEIPDPITEPRKDSLAPVELKEVIDELMKRYAGILKKYQENGATPEQVEKIEKERDRLISHRKSVYGVKP